MPTFERLPQLVTAIRLTQEMLIMTPRGQVAASPGDWLITGLESEQYPIGDKLFHKLYKAADATAREYIDKVGKFRFDDEGRLILDDDDD